MFRGRLGDAGKLGEMRRLIGTPRVSPATLVSTAAGLGDTRELVAAATLNPEQLVDDLASLAESVDPADLDLMGAAEDIVTSTANEIGETVQGVVDTGSRLVKAVGRIGDADVDPEAETITDIIPFSKVAQLAVPFLRQQVLSGFVMMMLGRYMFGLSNAAYQNLTRTTQYRWPSEERIGRRPALQFVGTGSDVITLNGTIYPEFNGGLAQIDALREQAGTGEPLILVDGLGNNYQQWCVVRIKETARVMLENSAPRRIDFEIELSRYGRDQEAAQ